MDRDALEAIREAGAAHNQAVGITSWPGTGRPPDR